MKLISIDYGRRRIGVAAGGSDIPVRGLPTIDRKKHSAAASLAEIIGMEQPDALLFGLPLDSNDAETVMSNEVRTFARKLQSMTGLPVFFIDESRSSLQAEGLLRYRKKKQRRDKGSVDRLAACLLLDQYIRENGCS